MPIGLGNTTSWGCTMYFEDAMFDLFDRVFSKGQVDLPVDVYQEDSNLVFEFAVAGYDGKNISAEAVEGVLIVSFLKQEEPANRKYLAKKISRKERTFKFAVPVTYDIGKAKAELNKGILKITIPAKETRAKNILKIESK